MTRARRRWTAGTRHILENINLVCIPGDPDIDCGMQSQVSMNEFVSGDSTCEGDSGSSAYEQKNFDKNVPVSFGVLSRGGTSGTTCVQPIYTRTDAWKDFIVNTALMAATAGGYTPPAWTAAPPPDGGTTTPDAGDDGGSTPAPGTLGAPCRTTPTARAVSRESDDGGNTYICSQNCDPTQNGADCALPNYQCISANGTGYCFPDPPAADAGSTSSSGSSGCAVGRSDPSKPVPWGTVAFAGAFVAVAFLRQRRRRSEGSDASSNR